MTTTPMHLGDAELDDDHDRFHTLVEHLQLSVSRAAQLASVDALRLHAGAHFATEDAQLRAMGGGNAQCHLDEHAAVLKSLDDVRRVLLGDGHSVQTKQTLVQRLGEQLADWLPYHVQEMDAAVATARARARFGGAPVHISRTAVGR